MTGGSKCVEGFHATVDKVNEEVKKTVAQWVVDTALISQENYCPVDTGLMKSTYRIITLLDDATSLIIECSVGNNGEAPYTLLVHEIDKAHLNPPSAQYKFLSTPFTIEVPKLNAMLEAIKL
jgi:hypothetical protein